MALEIADLDIHLQRIPAHRSTTVELCRPAWSPQHAPDFMFGGVPDGLSNALFGNSSTGSVRCYTLRHFSLARDGVLQDGRVALSTLATNHPADYVTRLLASAPRLPTRQLNASAVTLCGPGTDVFGHWLIDFLPRLHVLSSLRHKLSELKYIVPQRRPRFVDTLLATFGVGQHQLVTYDDHSEILEVAELIVPSNLRHGARLHPLFRAARDTLLGQRASTGNTAQLRRPAPTRLFLLRRGGDDSRSLTNRLAVERLAAEHGFALIDPATLDAMAQVALFQSASEIIGEYGSGLHGCMFSKPGTVVCALRGTSLHPGFLQTELAGMFRQRIGYVFGATPLDAIRQEFCIAEGDFARAVRCSRLLAASHRAATRPVDFAT